MRLILLLLNLYTWILILRAVLSWLPVNPHHPAMRLLRQITEPVLRPLRRIVPPEAMGGIDVSPILAILAIQVLRYLLFFTLW